MPSRHLWWFVEQMPILQARESIMRINEFAYAFGAFSKEDGNTYFNDLKIQAAGPDKPISAVAPRASSMEEFARAMGHKQQVSMD